MELEPFSLAKVAECVRRFGAAVLLSHPDDGPLFSDGAGHGHIVLDAECWSALQKLVAARVLVLRHSRFIERGTLALMAPNMLQGWGWGLGGPQC